MSLLLIICITAYFIGGVVTISILDKDKDV